MEFQHKLIRGPLFILFVLALSVPSFAAASHDRTQFGRDIVIGPGENASDATCFGCSVRVRGHIQGDATVFGGSIVVEDDGKVNGDTTCFGGNVRLENGATVQSVTVFGGHVYRDARATVLGDVTNFGGGPIWLVLIFGFPFVVLGAFIALIVWLVRRMTRHGVPVAA